MEMGSGLIKAGMKDGRRGGKRVGDGEVKKCSKYNIAERVAFGGGAEHGGVKTDGIENVAWRKLKGRGGRKSSVGSSLVTFDPGLFMIKQSSHPCQALHVTPFHCGEGNPDSTVSFCIN